MNKFVKLHTYGYMMTMDQYKSYQDEMEQWSKDKELIGKTPNYSPPTPQAKYFPKWINFGIHSVDQWIVGYDSKNDHPIIVANITHLPTSKSMEVTIRISEKEWMDMLSHVDPNATFSSDINEDEQSYNHKGWQGSAQ